jgi:hypothetical protein
MHAEEVALELEISGGGIVVLRVAQQEQRVTAEKDQPSARPEQPGRLQDPAIGVTPDRGAVFGEREVEALVAERSTLRVGVHEREP